MQKEIYKTDIYSKAVNFELAKLLADEYGLYTKTKNAKWNIQGTDFYEMHLYFENQFKQIDNLLGDVSERIRSLTLYAYATLKSFLILIHHSFLETDKNDCQDYLKELLVAHESIIIHCKENILLFSNEKDDFEKHIFIQNLMENHEIMAWFIRSHLN